MEQIRLGRSAPEFRAIAREKLQGNWQTAVLLCFVAVVLGAGGIAVNSDLPSTISQHVTYSAPWYISWLALLPGGFALLAVLAPLLAIAAFVVGGAAELGMDLYFNRLMRNEARQFKTLFDRFSIFGKALGLRLFMSLFIFLWALLLVIPGFIAAYRYAMAPYLMADNPNLGIREAVDISKSMMDGHKGRLFYLHLTFIGWALLCVVTLGIGTLWLVPYMQAAQAAFYMERSGQPIPQPVPDDGPREQV